VKNVLIVDSDLGFVFWLGQALDAAGYDTLPARGVAEAISLLAEVRVRIDVILVRCTLAGAEKLVADLRWAQRGYLKALALIDEDEGESETMGAWDGWQIKPNLPDTTARKIFLELVQDSLANSTRFSTT
jgi:DNA-binding response OmpR family regulator